MEPSLFAGAKWIVETLLRGFKDDRLAKKEKWLQVATYLEGVADVLQNAVKEFEQGRLPYGPYAQLEMIGKDFGKVLGQAVAGNSAIVNEAEFTQHFFNAVRWVETADGIQWPSDGPAMHEQGRELLNNILETAGVFRGLAMTLRATA